MNKVVQPNEVGSRSGKSKKSAKRRPGIILLEPRVMYDGAAAVSAAHHGDHHHHNHPDGEPTTGAPAAVRPEGFPCERAGNSIRCATSG